MRMRFVRPLLAVLAVAGLAACSGTPTPGSTGSASQAPSSSAPSSSSPGKTATPSASAATGAGNAELSITLVETPESAPQTFTLVCKDGAPAAESSHPSGAEACSTLKSGPSILSPAPTRTDQACTMQYGGPATAKVTGSVDGKEVNASFKRSDGCQIALWDAAKSVLGSDGGL
ncbi:serine protease inhibitor [Paenarthrobacter sp. MSM-2-10-13]|uniref:SSI family serine proteinase inhibitor n=1 Tax=Paenarthrobacter sp. MSM-2-10-13 TaxID=2717318 RepID=UPI001421950C|nr:SSI family serine proteinase inhibitor [Paenarthrobacter sp. MSM-2-10-13]NHW46826.1 serine protease inhibitor [Paenarthrobacter sp. MSM-2-10-13]